MAQIGMDADEVDQLGRRLEREGARIGTLVSQLDRLVNEIPAIWRGSDAQRFVAEWWPQHRQSLTNAQSRIDELSQAVLNNAADQRATSADGSPSGTAGAMVTPSGSPAPSASTHNAAANNSAAAAKFVSEWQGQFIDPDRSWGAQCFDVFRQYSNEVVGAAADIATDSNAASDIYNHYNTNGVAQYYDRIPAGQGQPQAGDIIVYEKGAYGHVALVTGVAGSSYSVLEQNYTWQDNISGNDVAAVHTYSFSDTASGVILGYLRPKSVHI